MKRVMNLRRFLLFEYIYRSRQTLGVLLLSSIALSTLFFVLPDVGGVVHAAADTVDPFSTSQSTLAITSSVPIASSTVSGPDILGGERDLQIEMITPSDPDELRSQVTSDFLGLEYGVGIRGVTRVLWDGPGGGFGAPNYTGLGGVDLTESGTQNAFLIDILFQDNQGAVLTITVYSDAGNSSIVSQTLPGGINNSTNLQIAFNSFSVNSGSGADFTSVGIIMLEIMSVDPALDMRIDSFGTTGPPPTPTLTPTPLPPSDSGESGSSSGTRATPTPPPSPTPTPLANFPTELPETGEPPYDYSFWPGLLVSLVIISGFGVLLRLQRWKSRS